MSIYRSSLGTHSIATEPVLTQSATDSRKIPFTNIHFASMKMVNLTELKVDILNDNSKISLKISFMHI